MMDYSEEYIKLVKSGAICRMCGDWFDENGSSVGHPRACEVCEEVGCPNDCHYCKDITCKGKRSDTSRRGKP